MRKNGILAIFLCVVLLLAACAGPITAEEAIGTAAEHLRAEYEGVKFRSEEAVWEYREFDGLCCYIIDIPDGHHVYRVTVDADSGEVIDAARCK